MGQPPWLWTVIRRFRADHGRVGAKLPLPIAGNRAQYLLLRDAGSRRQGFWQARGQSIAFFIDGQPATILISAHREQECRATIAFPIIQEPTGEWC